MRTDKEIKMMAANSHLQYVANPTRETLEEAWETGYRQAMRETGKYITAEEKDFLRWFYERMVYLYDVNPNTDWMQRLKSIMS